MASTPWYKQAIFYQINLISFFDGIGTGRGNLRGLTQKLDYLQSLGIDCFWLMPITKSPLRDGGYDVSDMFSINPDYGDMEDFRELVREAHKRGLRIMVEMIPNHTSDQHPWFQASRDPSHPEHEKYKDYYVWSKTDKKYQEARIIFIDFEKSNWTFDPLRREFFWHRFFYHQPDLNYDNPDVQRAMMRVIQFWIDQGADAIRVDAPPYLIEREGTNCENLPESHAYYKRLRKFVEAYAPDTMLLAEANQWPEDTREYFGDGDEFHMNFHFPLMPRLFMALAKADRTPIEQILARTPELPESCQWGIFLRCHDELTLEMVIPDEREFMWNYYAPQPRMRINLGIRRRLAPLLENDRRKIRLMHSILLSFIGSPVMYYGDEIGMGDNIALEDRDGVRTPMQWDASPNAGFTKAPAEKMKIPVISDPVYGSHRVNVAAAEADPDSLLQWLRKVIRIRKQHPVFGSGKCKLLPLDNKRVLVYIREGLEERILAVVNLSESIQTIQREGLIDGSLRMIDLLSGQVWQPEQPLPLQPYGFHWWKIED